MDGLGGSKLLLACRQQAVPLLEHVHLRMVSPRNTTVLSAFPPSPTSSREFFPQNEGRGALQHLLSTSRVVPSAATYCVHFLKLCGPDRTTGLGGGHEDACQARVRKLGFPFSIMVLRTLCFSNSEAIILKSCWQVVCSVNTAVWGKLSPSFPLSGGTVSSSLIRTESTQTVYFHCCDHQDIS